MDPGCDDGKMSLGFDNEAELNQSNVRVMAYFTRLNFKHYSPHSAELSEYTDLEIVSSWEQGVPLTHVVQSPQTGHGKH